MWRPGYPLSADPDPIVRETERYIRARYGGAADDLEKGYTGSARSEYYDLASYCERAPGLSWYARRDHIDSAERASANRSFWWDGSAPVVDSGTGFRNEPGFAARLAGIEDRVPPVLRADREGWTLPPPAPPEPEEPPLTVVGAPAVQDEDDEEAEVPPMPGPHSTNCGHQGAR